MADLIIKDMEMPKACGFCCFCTIVSDGDECAINSAIVTEYQKRPKDCPLRPFPEKPPRTNGDMLRAANNKHIAGVVCTGCPPGMETGKQCTGDGACYDCWLDWLQSPADGGNAE